MGKIFHILDNQFGRMENQRKIIPTISNLVLKETGEEEFVEDKVVNSHELAYVDEKNCWAQCLINMFDRAKELN